MYQFQKILRWGFYILAALTVILWLLDYKEMWTNHYWVWTGFVAVGCSLIRFFTRMV